MELRELEMERDLYLEMPNQTCEIIRRIEHLNTEIAAEEDGS
jgi:hypothetical protein